MCWSSIGVHCGNGGAWDPSGAVVATAHGTTSDDTWNPSGAVLGGL
jgi:hypothetical protein